MRGFEEIGCFFYKGLLKGLGWGRENWRSENFEVTSQVLFFHFAIKHGWNIHSVQWFSLSNSMEKLWGFPKKPPLPQKKTMCGCYMSLLSPFSINHYYMKTIGCLKKWFHHGFTMKCWLQVPRTTPSRSWWTRWTPLAASCCRSSISRNKICCSRPRRRALHGAGNGPGWFGSSLVVFWMVMFKV